METTQTLTKLLTVRELASALQINTTRTYQLIRRGYIRPVRLGRQLRVSREEFHEFVRSGGSGLDRVA